MIGLPPALSERAARLGVRARLLLLVLALGLPFLAYIALSSIDEAHAGRELAKERSLAVARVVAARLDDYVGDINQMLATLSHVAATGPEHATENNAILAELRPDLPSYVNNVSIWGLSGDNIGSLAPQGRGNGIADRNYFRDAIAGRRLSVEAPLMSRSTHDSSQRLRARWCATTPSSGVVSASTQLKHVQGFLDREGTLPKDSVITVISPQGFVLARSADTDAWVGEDVSRQGSIVAGLAQREGLAEGTAVDTVPRLYGYTTARRAAMARVRRHPGRIGAGARMGALVSEPETRRVDALCRGARCFPDRPAHRAADAAARRRRGRARRRRPRPPKPGYDRR